MKSCVLLSAVLLICHVFVDGRTAENYSTGQLTSFLENFKKSIQNGDEKLGIPVLDPFVTEHLPFTFHQPDIVDLDVILSDVNAKGLSNYIVERGDFALIGLKIGVGLTLPEFSATTGYTGKGNFGGILDVFGTGTADVTLRGLTVNVDMSLRVENKKLQVKSMDIKVSLDELNLKITGLYDDEELSELLSAILSELAPELIADYPDLVSENLNSVVTSFLNNILKDMSMKDLLAIIGG